MESKGSHEPAEQAFLALICKSLWREAHIETSATGTPANTVRAFATDQPVPFPDGFSRVEVRCDALFERAPEGTGLRYPDGRVEPYVNDAARRSRSE
jgi:hypothetical protein